MPERLRVLGFVDTTLLWVNLGISLLVLVLPAYFDLSLKKAIAATLVGGLIGNSMLALAALIGADGRVPTMVLQRAPLGRPASQQFAFWCQEVRSLRVAKFPVL